MRLLCIVCLHVPWSRTTDNPLGEADMVISGQSVCISHKIFVTGTEAEEIIARAKDAYSRAEE